MKIGFVSASISRRAGGLFFSMVSLSRELSLINHGSVGIYGLSDSDSQRDSAAWEPLRPEVFQRLGPDSVGYSPLLERALLASKSDLFHTQGIWQGPSLAVHNYHKKTQKPYLISPHGMLDSWALANSRWKKRIAAALYEDRHLRDAACLHALCDSEARSMRAYGLKNPIATIPNGVDLLNAGTLRTRPLKSRMKMLLFLSRIHPKKGLVNALRAWSEVVRGQGSGGRRQEEWQLVIAGWDEGGHEAELKRLCDELGLSYSETPASEFINPTSSCPLAPVVFVGAAFGAQKDELLRSASAFILPSFSEGLPMAVLEAWAYRLPVLMTDHCNLPEGFESSAAIRIGVAKGGDTMSIKEGVQILLEMGEADRLAMGLNGRGLVERQFTWPQVAAQMMEVYEWMLGGGVIPDCVRKP